MFSFSIFVIISYWWLSIISRNPMKKNGKKFRLQEKFTWSNQRIFLYEDYYMMLKIGTSDIIALIIL